MIKGSKKNLKTGNFELGVNEVDCAEDADEACPVQIIHIVE